MIGSPNYSYFRTAEFIQFKRNIVAIVDTHDAGDLGILAQRDALELATNGLDEEFKKPTGSELTARLIELDLKRDQALSGISTVIRGYTNHFEEASATAAERLAAAIKLHGPDIAILRYQQETSVINSILADFTNQAELAAAVTALNLNAWVAYLGATNAQFDQVYVQRSQQTAGDPSKVLELRATATQAWDALKAHLTAHATLTPTPARTQTISEINSLIDDYNQAVAGRGDTAPEAPAEPTPA